jgi:hypothetical protein
VCDCKCGGLTPGKAATAQDEGQRAKTGLAASKLELDARPLQAETVGRALAANQKVGLAAALLEVCSNCLLRAMSDK